MTRGIPAAAMALAAVTAWGGAALSRAPAAVLDGRAVLPVNTYPLARHPARSAPEPQTASPSQRHPSRWRASPRS